MRVRREGRRLVGNRGFRISEGIGEGAQEDIEGVRRV